MAIITQTDERPLQPFGTIQFDEYERNEYVSRLLQLLKSTCEGTEMREQVYEVHQELATRHDLYMAVWSKLESSQRTSVRALICDYQQSKPSEGFCGKRMIDGEVCIMPVEHKGDCRVLPF